MTYREGAGQTFRLEAGSELPPKADLDADLRFVPFGTAFMGLLAGLGIVMMAFGGLRMSFMPVLTTVVGYVLGNLLARWHNTRRHGVGRARDTTLERVGGRVIISTNDRTFEVDVADVKKANWIVPSIGGDNDRFGAALMFADYGVVVCAKELPGNAWRTTEYVAHPASVVDEDLFRRLADAVLPEPLERIRVDVEAPAADAPAAAPAALAPLELPEEEAGRIDAQRREP